MLKKNLLISLYSSTLILSSCSSIDTTREYSSNASFRNADLVVPPGLSAPNLETEYKIVNPTNKDQVQNYYNLDKIKDINLVQGGSERWIIMNNKTVNQVWPIMISYINQLGLTVKYQNQNVGLIQTDWATRNTTVNETGIRQFFNYIGWGSMYSLSAQYMYRVTLWQNESNTLIFVTNYQMNEVYPGCITRPNNSKNYSTSNQSTIWIPVPPDPQLELNFLMQFMAFTGLNDEQIHKIVNTTESAPQNAYLNSNGQIVINDPFERAWWRTSIALERVGLGISDKNISAGEYYVYQLKSQIDDSDRGWFGSSKSDLEIPKPIYTVKLRANNEQTILSISPYGNLDHDKNYEQDIQKYLDNLIEQLK